MMNLDEIKQILELVREHELTEFELEGEGLKIRIKKDALALPAPLNHSAAPLPLPPDLSSNSSAGDVRPLAPLTQAGAALPGETPPVDAENVVIVKSPIVGTFYRSNEPGAAPFVEVGQRVKRGQVLCIIEAMKLMNEIDSEFDGEISSIFVENGQPVQYGERLFAIRRA